MTSVNENALNKPEPTNHIEWELPRSEICLASAVYVFMGNMYQGVKPYQAQFQHL